jgi:Rod binding domain-containing protein
MDGADLILTTPIMPPSPLETTTGGVLTGVTGNGELSGATPAGAKKTEQLAKDFESVLLTQLVDKMKETIGQGGFEEEDAASGQVQGLFWLYLARDIADKGGLGLWKDLYRFFNDMQKPNAPTQSLDENL